MPKKNDEETKFIPGPMLDEEEAWDSYDNTVYRHERRDISAGDEGAFLPSPLEIRVRIGQYKWLQSLGFTDGEMCSIMCHECPTLDVVRRLVRQYGAREAKRRLVPMFERTEYDKHLR